MSVFKCGNWTLTNAGIHWGGQPDYLIPRTSIGQPGSGYRKKMYDSLVHMTEKTWLSRDDLYSLNTTYIFALEYYNIGFSPDISLVETLKEQQKLLDERDDEPESDELTLGGGD